MKVDLHVHTKQCKSGDGGKRNVTVELFEEKVRLSEVKVLAITNHNHFDLKQYEDFREAVKDCCDVWPGVEFDVKQLDTNAGHVIVVVNPIHAAEFAKTVSDIVKDTCCDEFCMTVDDLTTLFNKYEPVFISHFYKPKSLGRQDMELLEKNVYNHNRLLKEPSNITSIGVLNAYNHKCLLGSDVKDWAVYEKGSFSDFKYDFEGFCGFLKLLDKDVSYINDLLQKKFLMEVTVYGKHKTKEFPFTIKVFNDVNIIFGDKGSGKSEIIDSLEDYFNSTSKKVLRYTGGDKDSWFQNLLTVDISKRSYSDMYLENDLSNQFQFISEFVDKTPVSIDEYVKYFSNKSKNEKKEFFKIINFEKFNDVSNDALNKYRSEASAIKSFIVSFQKYKIYENDPAKYSNLINVLNSAYIDAWNFYKTQWILYYSHLLFDRSLDIINQAISECIGNPPIPSITGFFEYAANRLKLFNYLNMIKQGLATDERQLGTTYIGDVGDKGSGYITEHLRYISSSNVDAVDAKCQNGRKERYKEFNKCLDRLLSSFFTDKFIENNICLKKIIKENDIKNIDYFLSDQKIFTLNGTKYTPSKGEKNILAMQHDFISKKEQYSIFLMDEPEAGLGNEYIEKNIVTLIKGLAKSGKTVYIATHNANIAVRTLPANTILKIVDNEKYSTYQGSMFTNKLINLCDINDVIEWNIESEKHLEGGKEAFEERGYYYG